MRVLLSIKPEYAFKIFDGSKKFEFRKSIFKRSNVNTIVVYASSPVQRVIGEFRIEDILHKDPEALWQITKKDSGVSKDFYDEYFHNREKAFAIKIGEILKYKRPKHLSDFKINTPPQSFVYI